MIKLDDFIGKLMFGEKVHIFSIDTETIIFKGVKNDFCPSTDWGKYRVCTFYVVDEIIIVHVKKN